MNLLFINPVWAYSVITRTLIEVYTGQSRMSGVGVIATVVAGAGALITPVAKTGVRGDMDLDGTGIGTDCKYDCFSYYGMFRF